MKQFLPSLYIHVPFCRKKCSYCSFVVSIGQEQRMDAYLDCLKKEAQPHAHTPVKTVYIGGGTPTLLDIPHLKKLQKIIKQSFKFSEEAEVTIESNPEGLDEEKIKCLRDLGFNRVSLGVQSLNDKYLKFLGRVHDAAKARKAFVLLRKAGFKNVSVDLMYDFPQQSMAELKKDLKDMTALGADHVSLYALTIEENSKFFVQNLKLQKDAVQKDRYELVAATLEKNGYQQYEISNFSKKGKQSKHNLNYWTGGDYIGLGIGAHSHKSGRRSWNIARLTDYIKRMEAGLSAEEGFEALSPQERLMETLLVGLRMNEGVNVMDLQKTFRFPFPDGFLEKVKEFAKAGLLSLKGDRLKATLKGKLILDEICSRLI